MRTKMIKAVCGCESRQCVIYKDGQVFSDWIEPVKACLDHADVVLERGAHTYWVHCEVAHRIFRKQNVAGMEGCNVEGCLCSSDSDDFELLDKEDAEDAKNVWREEAAKAWTEAVHDW